MKTPLLLWLVLLWLALILATAAPAQDVCPEYDRLIHEAETFSRVSAYQKALYKYNSAKTCSPSRRAEVDSMINRLFVKIENEKKRATAAEASIRKIYDRMQAATSRANEMEIEKNNADSSRIADRFKSENSLWIKRMPPAAADSLLGYVVGLSRMKKLAEMDTLATFFRILSDIKDYDSVYLEHARENETAVKWTKLPEKRTGAVKYYGLRGLDAVFYSGCEKTGQAGDLLPVFTSEKFRPLLSNVKKSMEAHRAIAVRGYWMPDTLIGLPGDPLFARHCADNKNFTWAYSDYDDYKKLQVRFLNLSLTDFRLTTDSLEELSDTGRFYTALSAAGNYRYLIARGIDYRLKKNKGEYKKIEYAVPSVKSLMDNRGNILVDFSKDSLSDYFFSPDAGYLATWKGGHQLFLFNLKEQKVISLPDAVPAPTVSISSDSRAIAYYNSITKLIYIADMQGHILDQIPSWHSGIFNIDNIDFTGGDDFLKINNKDSICLFDMKNRRTMMRFNKAFVDEIVVSPNKTDILVTCNTESESSGTTYKGYLAILTDAGLNIRAKLYSGCQNFFYTPGGDYIIGYGQSAVMRWATGNLSKAGPFQTCLSLDELIKYDCFPFARFAAIDDADQIERGARKFKDRAAEVTDPIVKALYYRQSRALFDRLAYGNAKNIRKERVPFFYDWYNWIDNRLGNRNFRDQFIRQQAAVQIFDDLVYSPDSVYPNQLYYAANGNMFLGNLYDSLGAYNNSFIDQIIKEVSIRQRVFNKDPDNVDNIYYYRSAFWRLSAVCDSVGWIALTNRQYPDRLNLFRMEASLFAEKISVLPDSFDLQKSYINALCQLGASYIYVYASRPAEYGKALDSALYYADKGLALSPGKFDSARCLIIKARAYLLQEDGMGKAMDLYRLVKSRFPELSRGSMLSQLQYLKDAGFRDAGRIRRVEEVLKQE